LIFPGFTLQSWPNGLRLSFEFCVYPNGWVKERLAQGVAQSRHHEDQRLGQSWFIGKVKSHFVKFLGFFLKK
jgi:hypothetical protein